MPATNSYTEQQPVTLTGSFYKPAIGGVLTDPTTVTCLVQDPAGTITTYTLAGGTVTRVSTGVYTVTVTLNRHGTWYYRFEGTGTVVGAGEWALSVSPSQFYAT